MKILLLEDDNILSQSILDILKKQGFDTTIATNAEEAIDLTYDNTYDFYIFDINLPNMSGLELLQSLKEADDKTPAIFISADIDIDTIAKGFEIGAKDYIKKPFAPAELLIRLNAKLEKKIFIEHKDIRYDSISGEIYKDNKRIHLSYSQFKIFDCLFKNIGNIVKKDTLMEESEYGSDTALRVGIGKIKNTFDLKIINIRGEGYMIE